MSKRVLNEDGTFSQYTKKSCAKALQEQGHPNFQKPERAYKPKASKEESAEDEEEQAVAIESLTDAQLDEELKKRQAIKAAKAAKDAANDKAAPSAPSAPGASNEAPKSEEDLKKLPVKVIQGLLDEKKVDWSSVKEKPKAALVAFAAQHLLGKSESSEDSDL